MINRKSWPRKAYITRGVSLGVDIYKYCSNEQITPKELKLLTKNLDKGGQNKPFKFD